MNTVEILVNGKPVKQYCHESRTYIEARVDTEYSIKVKNNSCGRKLAVITVDGLNVITGQPHTSNTTGQGYIVGAYDAIEIKGFRKDISSVGAFKFCKSGHSYCNKKGLKGNNGVIGVRLYDEKIQYQTVPFNIPKITPPEPWTNPYTPWKDTWITCSTSEGLSKGTNSLDCVARGTEQNQCFSSSVNYCASNNTAPSFDVGTTWGKQINDSIVYTNFEPAETCYEDVVIYYDSRSNLEQIGIKFIKEKEMFYPKPFNAFAEPPKGWTGK